MTENEAIEKLRAYHKCQKMQVKGIYEDCNARLCDNCDLCYAQGNTGEHIKSIEIAIQALEKQIPKKPMRIERSAMGWEYMDYYCPCGKFIGAEPHIKSILEKGEIPVKYCDDCGQRLDFKEG